MTKTERDNIQFLVIDLFCGAGGVTSGFELARLFGNKIAKVIMCINHDPLAIASHEANHPDCLHFVEDIRTAAFQPMVEHLQKMKKLYPNARIILWASAECTNLSNAKGGKSRDPDSRTLSENLYLRWNPAKEDFDKDSYIQRLKPDYVMVENVREIMAWGPVIPKVNMKHRFQGHTAPVSFIQYDKKKKRFTPHWIPEDRSKGRDYQRWVSDICELGFRHDYRLLNAADFGAYTSRLRYFAIFAKHGLPIVWPEATHARNPSKDPSIFGSLQPWKPVREVLDLWDEGHSIFTRKTNTKIKKQFRKDLEETTLERIYAGMVKHVAGGSEAFLVKHMGNNEHTGINNGKSLDEPCITVTCQPRLYLAQPLFLSKYYGGKPESRNTSIGDPCGTVTTENRCAMISANLLVKNYSGEPESKSIPVEQPAGSLTTKDSHSLLTANFITRSNGGDPKDRVTDIGAPLNSLTTMPNQSLVSASFLTQRNGGKPEDRSVSLDGPARTLTASGGNQDIVSVVGSEFLDQQYGMSKPASVDQPAGALTANPKLNLVQTEQFMVNYYSGGSQSESINNPAIGLTTIPKQRLISAESVCIVTNQHKNEPRSLDQPAPTLLTGNHHYLLNAQFTNQLRTMEDVAPTITADRHWPYLVVTESGELAIQIYPDDSPATKKIKRLMAAYGIIDVKMRMLKVIELKRIQGFPEDYILKGAETTQKKHIGNSVVKDIPQRMAEALAKELKRRANNLTKV